MAIESINPATGELIRSYDEMSDDDVVEAIAQADDAFLQWRATGFDERASLLRKSAELLRERSRQVAELMALEMGKPVAQGRAEAEKCAWVCDYYADHAEAFLAAERIETDASDSFVSYQPLGIVLAVMPWNFPFWQVFRFAAPALMAGNAGLLKHASNVPGCALAIEELFRDAGFADGLFRALLVGSEQVEGILDNSLVRAATLTGSTPAGQAVASTAGRRLKKTVLELGGSDAYVVLEDADLMLAAETCAASRLTNSGQSCIAAKRFVVVSSRKRDFEELFTQAMAAARMGDPLNEETEVGPQARVDLRDDLHRQVQETLAAGAKCLLGGELPEGGGAFYPPTVLTDVPKGTPAYDEELFGPVGAILEAKDEEDAIRIANDSVFGLGAAVFTRDVERGREIATRRLEAGSCFVNSFVKSDPRLPFGGIKASGYGRELSHHGIREFTNVKTVYIA